MRQEIQAVNVDTLGKVFQNLEKHIQVCLDVKGDQFQHRLWAGPVLHRSRYVYINFQLIISIIQFCIYNILGPLARDSPCITLQAYRGASIQIFRSFYLTSFSLVDAFNPTICFMKTLFYKSQEYTKTKNVRSISTVGSLTSAALCVPFLSWLLFLLSFDKQTTLYVNSKKISEQKSGSIFSL